MKFIHKLIGFLIFIVLLGMGIMVMWVASAPERWEAFIKAAAATRLSGVCAAISFLCLAVVYGFSGLAPKKTGRFLSFDQEGGTVSISTAAISEYLAKLVVEFPSVTRMTPRVVPAKKGVDIVADVRVKAGSQIHEVCDLLQQRIRESMTEGLGITQINRVEVSVGEIVSEHKPA